MPRWCKFVSDCAIGAALIAILCPLASCSKKGGGLIEASSGSNGERERLTAASPLKSGENKFFREAARSIGNQMWQGYGLKNGYYGCAAAVCNVLKNAGHGGGDSAAVAIMRKQLLNAKGVHEFVVKEGGYEAIDDKKLIALARPGDVLVAFLEKPDLPNTGPNAHCGIMGSGTRVFTNDWNDGIWKEGDIHQFFDSYKYVRLIRLPE